MADRDLTVDEIIALCGGAKAVSAKTGLSIWAVYKWGKIGIPERWWEAIVGLSKVSEMQIREANKRARFLEGAAA